MADEKLRVYKHAASGYAEITSASEGGFSELTRTQVRNEPGALSFMLRATTPAMFAAWLGEVATVEYWEDGAKVAVYYVDDYSPSWSALTCPVRCSGALVLAKEQTYTGDLSAHTYADAMQHVVAAVIGLTWGTVNIGSGVTDELKFTYQGALAILQELAILAGATISVDKDLVFNAASLPASGGRTYAIDQDCWDFTPNFNATDIKNYIVITGDGGQVWVFENTASREAYGMRVEVVSLTAVKTQLQAQAYAGAFLAAKAWPRQELIITVPHDPTLTPGELVTVEGVGDGRTYSDVLRQVSHNLGNLYDELQVGSAPMSMPDLRMRPRFGGDAGVMSGGLYFYGGATPASGVPSGIPDSVGAAEVLSGTVVAVASTTVDVQVGGTVYAGVPFLASYSAPASGDPVAVMRDTG